MATNISVKYIEGNAYPFELLEAHDLVRLYTKREALELYESLKEALALSEERPQDTKVTI